MQFSLHNYFSCISLFSLMLHIRTFKESFSNWEILHVPRIQNIRTDNLARSARKQLFLVVHMDTEFPNLVCLVVIESGYAVDKKKLCLGFYKLIILVFTRYLCIYFTKILTKR